MMSFQIRRIPPLTTKQQVAVLVNEIARTLPLSLSARGVPYAEIEHCGERKCVPIRGRKFRRWLTWKFWERDPVVLKQSALRQAAEALALHALSEARIAGKDIGRLGHLGRAS
jgi:hypothetical protein